LAHLIQSTASWLKATDPATEVTGANPEFEFLLINLPAHISVSILQTFTLSSMSTMEAEDFDIETHTARNAAPAPTNHGSVPTAWEFYYLQTFRTLM